MCTQVEAFLHLVTELQEEVSRLRRIKEISRNGERLMELLLTFLRTGPVGKKET